MKRREWIALIFLAMTALPALLIGIGQIYVTGIDGARLKNPATLALLREITVLFLAFFLIFHRIKRNGLRFGLAGLLVCSFLWIHQVFLPVLVSGLYFFLLVGTGGLLRRMLDSQKQFPEASILTTLADLILGCSLVILLFCLMSLGGFGGIGRTRLAAFCLATCVFLEFAGRRRTKQAVSFSMEEEQALPVTVCVLMALIASMLLLQAGRMNLCIDYDSLHYGLRSEYILDNGNGIYENLGSVNVVYTYSKGLEILLLPLSGLPSHSFFLAFQLWLAGCLLLVCERISSLFVSRRLSLLCMAVISCIPGIMNMSVSAKTDMATTLFQLLMIYFLLLSGKRQKSCYLVMAVNAFMITMTLKPTALVFSTVTAGAAGAYLLLSGSLRFSWKGSLWISTIPTGFMWALVWLRTWLHTGLPVTSVFCSIWAMLGFQVRYPYRFDAIPSDGGSLFSKSGIKHILKRLFGVLVAPVGEDMAHVRIAWGTSFLVVFLVLLLLSLVLEMREVKEKERRSFVCLIWMFLANGVISLVALYLLWQVDGNYFMLLYAQSAILAIIAIGKFKSRSFARAVVKLLIPFTLFNVSVTAVSNWSGALGFSPVSFAHAGYYDHRKEAKELLLHYGNQRIWDILAEDPRNRVLVFGEQPELLNFPCNAQSYTDIEGSGGNFCLSAGTEPLTEFFSFAEVDYIYLGSGYLRPGSEGWGHVTTMLKQGILTDMIYENGSGLGRFRKEAVIPADPEAVLEEFSMKYWPGEQQ